MIPMVRQAHQLRHKASQAKKAQSDRENKQMRTNQGVCVKLAYLNIYMYLEKLMIKIKCSKL